MPVRWTKALEVWKAAQGIRYSRPEDFVGTPTGIRAMDQLGWIRAPFYGVIIARNKHGKTAFLLTLATAFAKSGFVVLFDMLEMSLYQMCTRLMANQALVDMDQYEYLRATEEDWERTDRAIERLAACDAYFCENKNTPELLNAEIAQVRKLHPDRKILVVADYAQLMTHPRYTKEYEQMTAISHYFKGLTHPEESKDSELTPERMLGLTGNLVSVLTAAQVTLAYKRGNIKITDASGSDTGAWGNDGDYLWAVNPVWDGEGKELPDEKEVLLTGRFTAGGTFKVTFNRAQARYQDYEPPVATTAPIYE